MIFLLSLPAQTKLPRIMKLLKQMMTWAALLVFSVCASAQNPSPRNVATGRGGRNLPLHGSAEFYQSAEARRIADQVLLYQRVTGGWPKNINMSRPLGDDERAKVLKDKERRDDSTTDNGATSMQMVFLAKVWQATKDDRYKEAFVKGVDYLLSGQYDNGGWPQFWPEMHGYQVHITYNDDAMVNTMKLLRDVADEREPYGGLADKKLRKRCSAAFDKGVECILKTQMRIGGVLTVWCQQHDRETYEPAHARAYELPSYCSSESAGIVRLLMALPNPDDRVKQAVHAAMAWFDKYKLTGLRIVRAGPWASPDGDTKLVEDATAQPLWARFYDLKYCEPYVCDRDGLPRRRLEDIGHERRNGYAWFLNRPAELYPLYEQWADKYDPQHKVSISLKTKGANENGLIEMFRQPAKDVADFDAVVSEGESIQSALCWLRLPRRVPSPSITARRWAMVSSCYRKVPMTASSADSRCTTTTGRWWNPATLPTRWRSSDVLPVPLSSTAISGLTVTMPCRYGLARATACTTMLTSSCVVRVSTSCVREAGAMPHAAASMATVVPSSGTTDGATKTRSWSSPTLRLMPNGLPSWGATTTMPSST